MNKKYLLISLSVATLTLFLLFSAPTAFATDTDAHLDGVVTHEAETEIQTSSEPVEVLVTLEDTERIALMEERKRDVEQSQRKLIDFVESREGMRVLNEFWISNAVLLELEPDFDHEVFRNIEGVRSVRSNTEIEILDTASVPSSSSSSSESVSSLYPSGAKTRTALSTQTSSTTYGVDQINAPDVWSQYSTKGAGVNVAVLDTGVNVSHPDIDLRTTNSSDPTYPGGWAEFDSNGNQIQGSEPYDSEGHGTHVSGTVAGDRTGVAPGANLMHGLIVNGNTGTLSQALSGMEWAVENDADVITMSLGGPTDDTWIGAVENANDMGVVVVGAVGNDGSGTSKSPGNVYDVVSVGAVDSNLDVPSFSSGEVIDTEAVWGDSALADWPDEYVVPDIVAAGVSVNSTSADGGYTQLSGTSMATPHVAGAAALVESASGGGTVEEMSNAFRLTAFGSGSQEPGTRYGYGAADALAATEFVQDDATVSGTVVNGSGVPVEEAELSVNNVYVDTNGGDYSVELAEGSWDLEATAPGYKDKTQTVSLAKDENAANDIVLEEIEPAFFEVSNLDGPSEAETGEDIEVNATVTNTGDELGTQDVTLRLAESGEALDGSTVVETRSGVSLGAGASKTVEFTVSAPSSEGEYDYGIFTDDSSQTDTMTVEDVAPAFFGVSSLDAPTEAETGESMTVTATVRNTGDASGTQDVTFRLAQKGEPLDGSAVVGTRSGLGLGPGESSDITFSFDAPNSEGDFDHGVFTDDDTETAILTVEQPPPEQANFEVNSLKAPGTVEENEEFDVNATVENTGGVSATQDVTFRLNESGEPLDGDSVVETRTGVSLASGEKTTVGFENLSVDEDGSFDHGVFTDDGSAEASLTVENREPAFFEVGSLRAPGAVEENEGFDVNATVENTGGVSATQDVTFRLNESGEPLDGDSVVETRTGVSLASGEKTTVEFGSLTVGRAGEFDHGVFNEDDNETASLTVEDSSTGGGASLSDANPFGDPNDNPVGRQTVIDRIVEWNLNGSIDGTSYTREEIIGFVVEWNLAQN